MRDHEFPRSAEEKEAVERLRSRMNVGRAIARWRMRRKLTQEEVARRAGTKQSRISELESLHGNVRFDTLDRITRALGLEITLQERSFHNAPWLTDECPTNWASAVGSTGTAVGGDTGTRLGARQAVSRQCNVS